MLTITILALLISASCTPNESKSATSATKTDTTKQTAETPVAEPAPAGDDIREMGLLKEVEDSGYPFVNVTIEFPERKFSEQFTINLESVKGVDSGKLSSWINRYVAFTYTSELTNDLIDIEVNGTSLFKEISAPITDDTKKITGILKGADAETTGDLPGTITITSSDNTTQSFSIFITKEMVAANGSTVDGFYEERTQNKISSIKLLPK